MEWVNTLVMGLKLKAVAMLLILTSLLLIPAAYSSSTQNSKLSIVAYPTKSAYLNNEEIQINYFVYAQNGMPVYGGAGHWELRFFYNNTVICGGNFTLPSGVIAILPQLYSLDTNRYLFSIQYKFDNSTIATSTEFFVVNHTSFYFRLNAMPLSGNYLRVIIDDNVDYMINGVYITIPVPYLPVDYISLWYGRKEVKNFSNPLSLDMYGVGEYNLEIPSNASSVKIFTSVAGKIMNVSYSPPTSMNFYFSLQNDLLLSGGYLNLSVNSVSQRNGALYYHFEVMDKDGSILTYSWGNSSGITYRIPDDYSGVIRVHCEIYNSTQRIYSLDSAFMVKKAVLRVYFDKHNYTANSDFYALVDFKSYVIKNATFLYNVMRKTASGYVTLLTKVTKERKLKIHVPENPPSSYKVVVYAISHRFQEVSSSVIFLYKEVSLRIQLLTKSSYVTHVYTPGQILEIRYSLSAPVEEGRLLYGFGDQFYRNPHVIFLGKEMDGTVKIRIPDDIQTGIYEIHFVLRYKGGEEERVLLINVDRNPSWTFFSILGMPLGHFVLILIFLVVLVLLMFVRISEKRVEEKRKWLRKRKAKEKKKEQKTQELKDGRENL